VVVRVGVETGTVSWYDSLGSQTSRITSAIKQWLIDKSKVKGNSYRERAFHYAKCRSREKSDDCMEFILRTMNLQARGMPRYFNTRSTAYYCCRIAAELLAGFIDGES